MGCVSSKSGPEGVIGQAGKVEGSDTPSSGTLSPSSSILVNMPTPEKMRPEKSLLREDAAAETLQAAVRGAAVRRREAAAVRAAEERVASMLDQEKAAATRITDQARRRSESKLTAELEGAATRRLQAAVRGAAARRREAAAARAAEERVAELLFQEAQGDLAEKVAARKIAGQVKMFSESKLAAALLRAEAVAHRHKAEEAGLEGVALALPSPDELAVRRLQSALRGFRVRRDEAAAIRAAEERVASLLEGGELEEYSRMIEQQGGELQQRRDSLPLPAAQQAEPASEAEGGGAEVLQPPPPPSDGLRTLEEEMSRAETLPAVAEQSGGEGEAHDTRPGRISAIMAELHRASGQPLVSA